MYKLTSGILTRRRKAAPSYFPRAIRQAQTSKRKGQMEYSVAMLGVELVILAVIIFTLTKIIANILQPHFQIAYANAELLRSTIDGLCEQGSGTIELEDWNFPQPQPMTIQAAGQEVFKNILPKFMIKSRGDPHFLLYYEAFPPPQAFGWELYQNLGDRLVMPWPYMSGITNGANATIQQQLTSARATTGVQSVVIPNIIIGNKTDMLPGSVGKWKTADTYSLEGYGLLPEISKSLVKYRACGDSMLCMKTNDGIIQLPLPNCKGKYDYIQMYRETGDIFRSIENDIIAVVGLTLSEWRGLPLAQKILLAVKFVPKLAIKVLSGVGTVAIIMGILATAEDLAADVAALFTATESDFGIASPCKVNMNIELGDCDCDSLRQLKLFAYDANANSLTEAGTYNTCWDRINGTYPSSGSISCVKIGFSSENGFCRTRNVVLPLSGFVTSFGEAAKYMPYTQIGAVQLKQAEDSLKPGFASSDVGWIWPGER